MSYTREVKVTHVEKEVLVWVPVHAELTIDMEVADSASLAEAGLCSLEELKRVREERDLRLPALDFNVLKARNIILQRIEALMGNQEEWDGEEDLHDAIVDVMQRSALAVSAVRARDADIAVLKDALKTAQDTREGAIARAEKAEAELARVTSEDGKTEESPLQVPPGVPSHIHIKRGGDGGWLVWSSTSYGAGVPPPGAPQEYVHVALSTRSRRIAVADETQRCIACVRECMRGAEGWVSPIEVTVAIKKGAP